MSDRQPDPTDSDSIDREQPDADDLLENHRQALAWELKTNDVTDRQALLDLLGQAQRFDRLRHALRMPSDTVRVAERTGNVVIDDGTNLLVLNPADAALLASELTLAAHQAENPAEDLER